MANFCQTECQYTYILFASPEPFTLAVVVPSFKASPLDLNCDVHNWIAAIFGQVILKQHSTLELHSVLKLAREITRAIKSSGCVIPARVIINVQETADFEMPLSKKLNLLPPSTVTAGRCIVK